MFSLTTLGFVATLFTLMQGQWSGEGERLFHIQNHPSQKVRIQAQVESSIENGILISKNEITETVLNGSAAGEVRQYLRVYWIRPSLEGSDRFELGYGPDPEGPVSSQGKWEETRFYFEQNMNDVFLVRGVTDFSTPDQSVYTEVTWLQGRIHSETTIRYIRR